MEKINLGNNSFIYPMPVTIVGANIDSNPNFITVSWITRVNADPPVIAVSINKIHHTVNGIKQNGSFSVNSPSADMIEQTDFCGMASGRTHDKSSIFDVFYGNLQNAPMIKQCPISMECRLLSIHEFPTNNLFIGEVISTYTENKYLTDGKPDIKKMNMFMLTMPDNNYWPLGASIGKAWSAGKNILSTK